MKPPGPRRHDDTPPNLVIGYAADARVHGPCVVPCVLRRAAYVCLCARVEIRTRSSGPTCVLHTPNNRSPLCHGKMSYIYKMRERVSARVCGEGRGGEGGIDGQRAYRSPRVIYAQWVKSRRFAT